MLRRHPWIFSGAVQQVEGDPKSGETVPIYDHQGQFLAWGAYSPISQIRARTWSFKQDDVIDRAFFSEKIKKALQLRQQWIDAQTTNAYRLIHAESDGLPGLIIDRYNKSLVIQVLSAGAEYWRDVIVDILVEFLDPDCIYERSDVTIRQLESLPERKGLLYGNLPEEMVTIQEWGLEFKVDLVSGQKTGFYLDQRENRFHCQQIANGRSVLNCFAYTGGFTVHALAGGADSVLSIDSSPEAIEQAKANLALNKLSPDKSTWIIGDVFEELRLLRDQGQQFDLIILDPPKFAPTAAQAKKAARGYKDINLYGFKLLKPGGTLITFSCSGGIDAAFFNKIIADAALDAEVDAKILYRLSQAPDHPTSLAFPEGSYLKGLVINID